MLLIFKKLKTKGKIKINSTSKIKNTRHKRKNRIEKGNRALSLGVNPHSKGLSFSWSLRAFLDSLAPAKRTTPLNRAETEK